MDPTNTAALVASLRNLKAGFLPYPIFTEITRLVTTPTIEVVVFAKDSESGALKISLLKRPSDDRWWPGQWHIPGSILRSTDSKNSFTDAFKRIEDEYGFKFPSEPTYLRIHFRQEKRGAAIAIQHYLVLEDQTSSENFFDVEMLPVPIVDGVKDLIDFAVKKVRDLP